MATSPGSPTGNGVASRHSQYFRYVESEVVVQVLLFGNQTSNSINNRIIWMERYVTSISATMTNEHALPIKNIVRIVDSVGVVTILESFGDKTNSETRKGSYE